MYSPCYAKVLRCKSTSHLFPAKALAALAALALAEGNIPKVACALHCLRGVKEPHPHGARVDARGGPGMRVTSLGSPGLKGEFWRKPSLYPTISQYLFQ